MRSMQKFIFFLYDGCLGFAVKVLGIVMLTSVVIQIATRYIPMVTIGWTEELARLTFIWFCFISAAMTLSRRGHLTIDYLYVKMGKRSRHLLDVFAWVVVTVFSSSIAVYGARLVRMMSLQRSPMLQLPLSYFYAAVPVGSALCALYALISLGFCLLRDDQMIALKD